MYKIISNPAREPKKSTRKKEKPLIYPTDKNGNPIPIYAPLPE